MPDTRDSIGFADLNNAYNRTFRPSELTLGLVVPLERYEHSPVPTMSKQLEKIRLADELGFSSVWLRDVPFNVPSFGDAGHIFDPFVYLGMLAGQTEQIGLGVASIILSLRHPAHVAKAAASVDQLSNGRLLLGVASGDRPAEYPAMGVPFEERGELFRESFEYIDQLRRERPAFENHFGSPRGIDMIPKPTGARLPTLITGGSQQSPEWIARHGDGWMIYPRDLGTQSQVVRGYRDRISAAGLQDKPVMQPLYVDLLGDPDAGPRPIHLGFSAGINFLRGYLTELQAVGINHVAINLRFNKRDITETLHVLADNLLTDFS